MSKLIRVSALALALTAMTAASAGATTGPGMVVKNGTAGTASNTGAISGNGTTYGAHTFSAGGGVVSCGDASFNITTVATSSVTFDPTYSNCRFTVAGTVLGAATVDSPCTWTVNVGSGIFNTGTGAGSGGTVSTGCVTSVTVPAASCTIHVGQVTNAAGITTQNIDAAGANSTAAVPWGSKIVAAVTGLTYTTTGSCLIAEHGLGSYAGTVAVRNVYGSL
jgi:hypothetical protein